MIYISNQHTGEVAEIDETCGNPEVVAPILRRIVDGSKDEELPQGDYEYNVVVGTFGVNIFHRVSGATVWNVSPG